MPVIAVINRKGGSGKSTLATHLAAWLAHEGLSVLLGDIDRQQSTRAWLKRRDAHLPAIVPWAMDKGSILKKPSGITHVVLDTPGGLHGFELAKVIMSADAVLIPVCNSMFDRESAAACHAELMALPRVASGRCQVGVVGMRIDARTHSAQTLQNWANGLHMNFLGVLRETQMYVRGLETGLTLFDLPHGSRDADVAQWEPVLRWLRPIARLEPVVATAPAAELVVNQAPAPRKDRNPPAPFGGRPLSAQEPLLHADPMAAFEHGPVPPLPMRH